MSVVEPVQTPSVTVATRAPRVSVVMPVRNGGRWLAEAIASVQRQTEQDYELIVVDDGSTDNSLAIVTNLAAADRRIRVTALKHQGLTRALNTGLSMARAPLIARLDADDVSYDARLETQADWLDDNPQSGLVGGWVDEIDEAGRRRGVRTPAVSDAELRRVLKSGNPFVHSTIMVRASIIRALGGYRSAFRAAEDYDLWLRASEVAEIGNIPAVLGAYRVHAASLSATDALRQAFSVRLAKRAASGRHLSGLDPADCLSAPPDWHDVESCTAFSLEAAILYRWLDHEAASEADAVEDARLLAAIADMTHAERRLAARSMVKRLASSNAQVSRAARRLLSRLALLHPKVVIRAAWSLAH